MKKLFFTILLAAVLAACGDEQNLEPPAELVDITPRLDVRRVWSQSLGGDSERLRLALRPQVVDAVLYAGAHDGEVLALNAETGRRLWRINTRLRLSAGPAVGDGIVVFGSSDGDLVAIEAATGIERWRHQMSSEVLAPPLVSDGMVFVRTVDGRLQALSVADATQRWTVQEAVPALSLRGNAPAVRAGDAVLTGFDNGKVLALDVNTGETLWDTTVSPPQGRTELDRLVDLDAALKAVGEDVYAVGFQGRAAMLALDSGQIWWARDMSSYRGFAIDEENLYITNAEGGLIAMRRRDGGALWEQLTTLRQRALTAPEIDKDALVVGDFEGYVHWLDKRTGEIIARARTDGERITNAPIAANGLVYVQTDAGAIVAFRTTAREVGG